MWKDWFTFSRNERFGLVVLFVLVCIAAVSPYVYQVFFFNASPLANSNSFETVDSFFTSLKYVEPSAYKDFSVLKEEAPVEVTSEVFVFDPNTISVNDLERLGFSHHQAKVIENYRKKGGFFREKNDFAKMYVVDSSMFTRLVPYIQIEQKPDSAFISQQIEVEKKIPEPIIIELNSADTLELIKLKGVGRSFARRIVAYRNLLGGFIIKQQLLEVWGFKEEMLKSIEANLTVDTTLVQKININMASLDNLQKHPYLTTYQAKSIIYYREKMGNIKSIDEILMNKLVDKETYRKVKGYLTVN